MVTRLLKLTEAPKPADAADALALAICQLWRGGAQAKLVAAPGRAHRRATRPGGRSMIASVRGTVAAVSPDGAVIELGGFGVAVSCSPGTLARLRVGDTARLATSLVVREDSLTLYGFADDDERALFELLQTANGVGPKLAQTILGVHPPREVRRAIATNDLNALIKVPGIGRKGAERIVLELRDRIGSIDGGSDVLVRPRGRRRGPLARSARPRAGRPRLLGQGVGRGSRRRRIRDRRVR